ncbi:transposase [Streptomyces sp. NPDC005500]|uniref:IS110 family transposase n=1 Tax=Streptomyces sp. NPDC005500 TaxID=3155007 RepID=UPI0033AEBD71
MPRGDSAQADACNGRPALEGEQPRDHARRAGRRRHWRRYAPRHSCRSGRHPSGAVLASTDSPANARGYQQLLDFGRQHVTGRRCWTLEDTGSCDTGLAAFLDAAGESVVEVCRPKRPAARGGHKTDMLDAVRAAREALATEHLIHPRRRRKREALRVLLATRQSAVLACTAAINLLKALIISAPDELRVELRGMTSLRREHPVSAGQGHSP